MQVDQFTSLTGQPVEPVLLERLKKTLAKMGLRVASRAETPLHRAADAHQPKVSVAIRYAFAMGRKALGPNANVAAATKAVRLALEDVLPPTLLKALIAGGEAGARQLRAAGDVEGHPFHGNQYTPGSQHVHEKSGKVYEVVKFPNPHPTHVQVFQIKAGKPYGDVRSIAKAHLRPLKALATSLTLKFNASDPRAVAWAKQHAAKLAKDISDVTEERVRAAIATALEGGTLDEARDEIAAAVGDEARAEVIARTESMMAANQGQREAWAQATDEGLLPADAQREWIATSGACPECDDLDGEVVGLDEEYPNDGGDGPPLHPNCRCTEGISGG